DQDAVEVDVSLEDLVIGQDGLAEMALPLDDHGGDAALGGLELDKGGDKGGRGIEFGLFFFLWLPAGVAGDERARGSTGARRLASAGLQAAGRAREAAGLQ